MIVGNEARRERLREAIARLPMIEGADAEGALNALQLGTYFATINELPRMTASRRKDGELDELRKFAKLAQKLHAHFNSMHRVALNALSPDGQRHALAIDGDLKDMIARAESRIATADESAASTSPRRLAPEQIAQLCAQLYTGLTGKRAIPHGNEYTGKKGGPYLRFLNDVYAALGIKANAEHYGRDAAGTDDIGANGGITMRNVRQN